MATMTITIAVSTKGFTWSRTASIADVTAAVTQISEKTYGDSFVGGIESTAQGDGLQSFSAIAVACLVNSGTGSLLKALTLSSSAASGGAVIPTGIPFIVYNGAGTGFTGGVTSGASSTITPTSDIESLQVGSLMGSPVSNILLGLKATS